MGHMAATWPIRDIYGVIGTSSPPSILVNANIDINEV
jgi:hypothetical protein